MSASAEPVGMRNRLFRNKPRPSGSPDNALTTQMHGDYRLSIDRFFVGFNAICSTFLRNNPICIEGRKCRSTTVLGYSINARGVGPRTPYRVGDLAGDFTRAWVSHSLANHWIYNFKASLLRDFCCVNYTFVLDKRNTAWLRDTVRQTSLGKSAAGADLRYPLRPLTSLGTFAWPYRVTTRYSYYMPYIYYTHSLTMDTFYEA